jgi:hypothetical protein
MGIDGVDIPGAQVRDIEPDKILKLLKVFEAIHFYELQDHNIGPCIDGPTDFISLSVDGRSKRIRNDFCGSGEPGPTADLVMLAQQIDSMAGASRWTRCNFECMGEQIRAGLNVNSRSPDGWSPLIAAIVRKNVQTVRLLLYSGAETNIADYADYTPLMYAAMVNSPEMVHELLAHGADVNARDAKGFGAVDMVEVGGKVHRILLKAGAKPHRK